MYTISENGLLIIINFFKEFRIILLGHQFKIYTNHKYINRKVLNINILLRWRLTLEEYGPEIKYIQRKKYI